LIQHGQHLEGGPGASARLCRKHGISRLALFGSRLDGTAHADSDVDLLVEFAPGATPGLIRMAEIADALSPLYGGCKIDLRTAQDLSRYFRDSVLAQARVHYIQ
jgi:uncharacterized protein